MLIVPIYLHTGFGPHGGNLSVLANLGSFLRLSGKPFIVGGEWNLSPKALADCGVFDRVVAEVVDQEVDINCTTGSGSYIDFFVVSSGMRGCVKAKGIDFTAAPRVGILCIRYVVKSTPPLQERLNNGTRSFEKSDHRD